MLFLSSADLFNSFRNTIRVSNSLDPDQARQIVGPDLGPNCLQKISASDTSRQRVKILHGVFYKKKVLYRNLFLL